MVLDQKNFIINAITIDINNNINQIDMNDSIEGFTNSNSASILGIDNMKYKILFSDFKIPENTKFVIFRISFLIDGKYYHPHFFVPINNENHSNTLETLTSAITFKLHNNNFNYIWFYLSIKSIDEIVSQMQNNEKMIEANEYIQKFISLQNTY